MKLSIPALASAAMLLAGCVPPQGINILSSDFESYVVVLTPNADETMLDILSPPQGWEKAGKKPGYVGFDKGKYGTITLALNELPSRSECKADEDESAAWVITSVRLSKNGNPNTEKGFNFGTNQTGWLTSAFPSADSNGVIWSGDLGNSKTMVTFENENNNNGKQMAYYEVVASKCHGDPKSIPTDPGVGNGGRR